MKPIDYIGLNTCLTIPYFYGFMSGYELIACFVTVPFAIAYWALYAKVMNIPLRKDKDD